MQSLAKIRGNWAEQSVAFVPGPGPADDLSALLSISDTTTDLLESDMLTLQTLATSKFVLGHALFQQSVLEWQCQLTGVDAVLTVWGDVQRRWQVCMHACA